MGSGGASSFRVRRRSDLIRHLWLDRYYDQRDTFPKIKGTYLEKLPIFDLDGADESKQATAARIADQAKTLTELYATLRGATDSQKETLQRRLAAVSERRLNADVYELYGLSVEDVQLVEGQADVEELLATTLELANAS
jgi:hypothetical protein